MKTAEPSSALSPVAKTWEAAYCERHGCTPAQFRRRIFWRALHRHALPFAPLLLLGNHFVADFELIADLGDVRSMRQMREDLEQHRHHPFNCGWLRQQLALRVSTQRLHRLAREYVSGARLAAPIASRGNSCGVDLASAEKS